MRVSVESTTYRAATVRKRCISRVRRRNSNPSESETGRKAFRTAIPDLLFKSRPAGPFWPPCPGHSSPRRYHPKSWFHRLPPSTSAIGKSATIWVASFHELQQSARHLRRQCLGSRAAACMGQHQIRVVKPEANIHAMERSHAVIEQRRLPGEPIDVYRCRLLGLHIRKRHHALPVAADQRPDFHGLQPRKRFRIRRDYILRLVAEAAPKPALSFSFSTTCSSVIDSTEESVQLGDCSF